MHEDDGQIIARKLFCPNIGTGLSIAKNDGAGMDHAQRVGLKKRMQATIWSNSDLYRSDLFITVHFYVPEHLHLETGAFCRTTRTVGVPLHVHLDNRLFVGVATCPY
jgi:hypothetical protein